MPPSRDQEVIGFLVFCGVLLVLDRISNQFRNGSFEGILLLIAIVWVACWSGIRSALAGCAVLVFYAWAIFHFHFPITAMHPERATSSLISTAITYPLLAVIAGLVQNKLRDAGIREFDANVAAKSESEQRRLAEAELWASEEMLRLIVHSSIDAVIGIDEHGTITTWNPNAEKLFGWSSVESVGHSITDRIVPRSGNERNPPEFLAFLTKERPPEPRSLLEFNALTKAGTEISVELYVAEHKTASGTLFIAFARDISDRKQAEEAVQELNTRLEERVAERTAQLEAANEELLGFTYSVSHDLRAPLRAIVANSRIVCDEAKGSIDPANQERLLRLEASALKMAELIENLLQFARIGQVPLHYQEVDLTAMAEKIAEDLKSHREGRVTIHPGMVVHGDPEMIKLALYNLMENAWKYTQDGETPDVEVGLTSPRTFYVRDRGIGFDMQYEPKIWEPFERLHLDSQYPGTGIGLANSKRIIARHGGKVWAESAPGKGTTIYFQMGGRKAPKERVGYAS